MGGLLRAALTAVTILMVSGTSGAKSASYQDTYLSPEIVACCEAVGDTYGICPELLEAIAERESSGDPKAVNGSHKGLCQISEKWHSGRMERLGITDIYDIESNLTLCADYLRELADQYEDIGVVLAKYHGESNAEKRQLSPYVKHILQRSEELERAHGK